MKCSGCAGSRGCIIFISGADWHPSCHSRAPACARRAARLNITQPDWHSMSRDRRVALRVRIKEMEEDEKGLVAYPSTRR